MTLSVQIEERVTDSAKEGKRLFLCSRVGEEGRGLPVTRGNRSIASQRLDHVVELLH